MTARKRTRLSPDARRAQLLDCAADFIQREGLSGFTMDALATEAGVSNPLIYKYFDTRLELLQELLAREYERNTGDINQQLADAQDFEEIVRIFVATNFEHASRSDILSILRNQPDIHESIADSEAQQQQRAGRFLVDRLASSYPLTPAQAEQAVVMGAAASQAAARHYRNTRRGRKGLIDDTVKFIAAGIRSLLS